MNITSTVSGFSVGSKPVALGVLGFGWFPGSQVQHEGDRCSKAIRDSSRTQWLTLSGARWRRLSSSFGLVTVLVDP